jgi:ABC-type Na+ efflux pump permease subunit
MHGHYNKAFIKLWVSMIFTLLLNHLCHRGLGLVSWIIVFIPFLLMSIIVTMLLVMFGFDPETGKLAIYDKTNNRVIKEPSSPQMDMSNDPRNPRSGTFDYQNFEEPSISEQRQEALKRLKNRRSDETDKYFDKEGKEEDDGSANYKRHRDLMVNTGSARYDKK